MITQSCPKVGAISIERNPISILPSLADADTVRTQTGYCWRKLLAIAFLLAAPQGFEPRYADPESAERIIVADTVLREILSNSI